MRSLFSGTSEANGSLTAKRRVAEASAFLREGDIYVFNPLRVWINILNHFDLTDFGSARSSITAAVMASLTEWQPLELFPGTPLSISTLAEQHLAPCLTNRLFSPCQLLRMSQRSGIGRSRNSCPLQPTHRNNENRHLTNCLGCSRRSGTDLLTDDDSAIERSGWRTVNL